MRRLFFVGLLFYCATTCAQISNLVVFGDSLSDSGNFPESSKIWWRPDGKKDLANTVPQLYVPFSNPVQLRTNNPYLPKQIPIGDSKQPRMYRSISWPQYFLINAKNQNRISSDWIAPSDLLNEIATPKTISVNYAWGYATSGKQCVNPLYEPIENCNAKTIFDAKKTYEKNPTKENYLKIQIPGLFEQVNLFTQDARAHKISVDQNTVYVFWIGGNDLITANNALLDHYNPLPALQFLLGSVATHQIKNAWRLVHELPANELPNKIYFFQLFNPALTPGYYGKNLGVAANAAIQCSNFWLKTESNLFNLFSPTKIVIVPVYQWFQKSAENSEFTSTMGKACQLDGRYPGDSVSAGQGKNECGDFMFWNAVHPATSMNMLLAKAFLHSLVNT